MLAADPGLALRYPIKKWAAAGGAAGGGRFYLVITGAAAADQRAFIMLAMMLLAILFDRPAFRCGRWRWRHGDSAARGPKRSPNRASRCRSRR